MTRAALRQNGAPFEHYGLKYFETTVHAPEERAFRVDSRDGDSTVRELIGNLNTAQRRRFKSAVYPRGWSALQ
jgi:hypothetical protein